MRTGGGLASLASVASLVAIAGLASPAAAEPIFLSRQYTRCTNCHYSPTGGGLLTPYGRSLTREELSTTGRGHGVPPGPGQTGSGEESFLWGALGNALGPVNVGIDLRPGHLDVRFPGGKDSRNLLMNAEFVAAYRIKQWTLYGELGRQPLTDGTRVDSWEHWVSYRSEKGLGIRAGRFLPAYGVRFADHTAFNRRPLGLDTFDQIYGVELSHSGDHHLVQVAAGPGRADSLLHDHAKRGFPASPRVQMDLTSRTVQVPSGLYHEASRFDSRGGPAGLALGLAPTPHLTIWTEADAKFQQGSSGAPAYSLVNETGYEVFRGVWLKLSPQLLTAFGDTSAGTLRLGLELNLLPRTHWNVDLSYYRDRARLTGLVSKTTLAQLHLYL